MQKLETILKSCAQKLLKQDKSYESFLGDVGHLDGESTMAELVGEMVTQIEQIAYWVRVTIYLVFGLCILWLVGFVRRIFGIDSHSVELRRIRRILESQNPQK